VAARRHYRAIDRAPGFRVRRRPGRDLAREGGKAAAAPRLEVLAHPSVQRVVGALCFALAVILVLPIPLGNMLPALAICIFSLGILARDGYWIIAGVITAIVAVAISSGVVYALVESAYLAFSGAFISGSR